MRFASKRLTERIIDFMRAGVQQIFALEINLCAAIMLRQSLGEIKRRGPPREIAQQTGEFALKRLRRVSLRCKHLRFRARRPSKFPARIARHTAQNGPAWRCLIVVQQRLG